MGHGGSLEDTTTSDTAGQMDSAILDHLGAHTLPLFLGHRLYEYNITDHNTRCPQDSSASPFKISYYDTPEKPSSNYSGLLSSFILGRRHGFEKRTRRGPQEESKVFLAHPRANKLTSGAFGLGGLGSMVV